MTSSIFDWFGPLLERGVLTFERRILEAVASEMRGEAKRAFLVQTELIEKVQVDPFKTCFSLIMDKSVAGCARIESKDGLILARVSGVLDGHPQTAEIGLCKGLLYAIVTNRPLSWATRKRKDFLVNDVVLYPRIAPVASEWEELIARREKLSKIEMLILEPEERWLHPWDGAWYLCLADIGSQYYILQRCDENGELILLDYIGNEIVLAGETPLRMMEYAYLHGDWLDDKNAFKLIRSCLLPGKNIDVATSIIDSTSSRKDHNDLSIS